MRRRAATWAAWWRAAARRRPPAPRCNGFGGRAGGRVDWCSKGETAPVGATELLPSSTLLFQSTQLDPTQTQTQHPMRSSPAQTLWSTGAPPRRPGGCTARATWSRRGASAGSCSSRATSSGSWGRRCGRATARAAWWTCRRCRTCGTGAPPRGGATASSC